jgi:mono/diheme cytochrome c family protein
MVAGRYLFAGAAAALFLGVSFEAPAQDAVARGKYLTTFGGCHDCHTPGYFFGKPDMARFLGGSDVGFEIPGLGTLHGPNLTPDEATGLGSWSEAGSGQSWFFRLVWNLNVSRRH